MRGYLQGQLHCMFHLRESIGKELRRYDADVHDRQRVLALSVALATPAAPRPRACRQALLLKLSFPSSSPHPPHLAFAGPWSQHPSPPSTDGAAGLDCTAGTRLVGRKSKGATSSSSDKSAHLGRAAVARTAALLAPASQDSLALQPRSATENGSPGEAEMLAGKGLHGNSGKVDVPLLATSCNGCCRSDGASSEVGTSRESTANSDTFGSEPSSPSNLSSS